MSICFTLRLVTLLFLGRLTLCFEGTGNQFNSTISNEVHETPFNGKKSTFGKKVQVNTVLPGPCERHLKRVESFIFPPKFRPFIPLCDNSGFYLPLQCHQSSGYCWCVDKNGNMKHGSRTKGEIDCGMKALKKPCEIHRTHSQKLQAKTRQRIFIPKCNEDGYYSPMQCSKKSKHCWCVNKKGNIKSGSKAKTLTDCLNPKSRQVEGKIVKDAFSRNEIANGPCAREKHRQSLQNAKTERFNPNCDEDGYYNAKQCHSGFCWCSDGEGNLIAGTRKKGEVDCDEDFLSGPPMQIKVNCLTKRMEGIKSSHKKKIFVPLCTPDGSYAPLQCDPATHNCWCSDKKGNEIQNTRTRRTPNCLTNLGSGKPLCYELKKYLKELPDLTSIYIPVCQNNGFYRPLQCSRDKKYCWCVDKNGLELKGTLMFGKTKCPQQTVRLTLPRKTVAAPCFRHKEKRKRLFRLVRRNLFNPRCNKDGFYDVKQCHGKYCWCTDQNGKMLRGTRTKGNLRCIDPRKRSLKPCFAQRLQSLRISLKKKPYTPQCESNGEYKRLQCNVYTGVCWCVDLHGNEVRGSRTTRTPTCFTSAFNSVEEGPCEILKSHVAKLPPNGKVYEPVCEGSGLFRPEQCGKTNGFCWCVLHDGTEVQGSLTRGQPDCRRKRLPAAPRLQGPCDQHLAHVSTIISKDRRHFYTPTCDNKGYYTPLQCDNGRKWCWCVDKYGAMKKGTRIKSLEKIPICDENLLKPCVAFNKKRQRPSESNRNQLLYKANCKTNGHFAPLQCDVKSGNCWCVDDRGQMIAGTMIYKRPYCGNRQRKCENERRRILSQIRPTMSPPSCDIHGYYSRLQCDHISGECWCTDRNGNKTRGTRVNGIRDCGQLPRPCDEHASAASEADNVFGVFVPRCNSQGYYSRLQCHEQTDICWCSNLVGVEIPGTKMKGQPRPRCTF
ncbi:thyroglobulin-like isoform X2 [Xenia sp. Carnegie-2017]|nr:thyroglobulin-like isoform X2 [Xenia sp. Carnegie-2017]